MSTIKRCTGCKHYIQAKYQALIFVTISIQHGCGHENNRSVVDGTLLNTPEALRYGGGCTLEGVWWEAA